MSADNSASNVAVAAPIETKVSAKNAATKKVLKIAKPKGKPTHPAASEMVSIAIEKLAERNGSSLSAIKKYIASNYKCDIEKQSLFIKKYLKSAVTSGVLIQVKGKGASGSFKLAKTSKSVATKSKTAVSKRATAAKKPAAKKVTTKKVTVSKLTAKKAASPKKTLVKKAAGGKQSAKPVVEKVKVSSKAKKSIKAPTAKPKAPKPKKVTTSKMASKVAPKKTTLKK